MTPNMLLACVAVGLGWIAPQAPEQLTVRVVDAATNAPVSNALVTLLVQGAAAEDWGTWRPVNDVAAWADARARLGVTVRTDATGSASLDAPSEMFVVTASATGVWAEEWRTDSSSKTLELRLEPDSAVEIRVTDASGATASSVPVGIVTRPDLGEHAPPMDFAQWLAIVASDEHGIARFPHAQRWLKPQPSMKLRAELALPNAQAIGVELDTTRAANELKLALVLPACGSLEVLAPGIERGYARIRRALEGEAQVRSMWSNYAPLRAEIVAGHARFPFVGIGLDLECEASWNGLATRVRMLAASPARPGGHVEVRVPSAATLPVLVGRVLDEQLKPISGSKLGFGITISARNSSESRGTSAVTDDDGRFRIELASSAPPDGTQRLLTINAHPDGAPADGSEDASAEVDISAALRPGEHDCGDIVVVKPGSSTLLGRMGDQALETQYAEIVSKLQLNGSHEREYETCLTEMARRGGEHWVAFLRREIDQSRERRRGKQRRMNEPGELVLLTALRRAERKPDPLAIELNTHFVRTATFPTLSPISFLLKNVDASESFELQRGGNYRSGRFTRCRIEAIDANDVHVEPLPEPGFMGGGMSQSGPLEPGKSLEFALDPTQYVMLPHAGEYHVRVQYHDQASIAAERDVTGWILASSQVFTVRFEPLKIRLTTREVASLKEWIATVDIDEPVVLVSGHWSPSLTFRGEPTSAADRLFRAGWNAVPVLIDALDDEHLEPKRRAWIVGLLWDIAGIFNPTGGDFSGALGNVRWVGSWPSSTEEASPSLAEFGDREQDIWAQHLAALSNRWRAMRSCVEFDIVD